MKESNSSNQRTGGFDSVIILNPHENIWQEEAKSMIRFNFCKKNELLQTPTGQCPREYFRMSFIDCFLDLVVNETNHHAKEILSKTDISSRSRIIYVGMNIAINILHDTYI